MTSYVAEDLSFINSRMKEIEKEKREALGRQEIEPASSVNPAPEQEISSNNGWTYY